MGKDIEGKHFALKCAFKKIVKQVQEDFSTICLGILSNAMT